MWCERKEVGLWEGCRGLGRQWPQVAGDERAGRGVDMGLLCCGEQCSLFHCLSWWAVWGEL